MSGDVHQQLAQAITNGEMEDAKALASKALEMGSDAHTCIQKGVAKGIQNIIDQHANEEYLLPDLLKRADAANAALEILEPAMSGNHEKEVIALVVLEALDDDGHKSGEFMLGTMLTDNDVIEKNSSFLLRYRS